jgi:pilus assembly protein Flp/PilA
MINKMKDRYLKLSVMLQILKDENGQDLIEYALVVALIAFAATAGMTQLAGAINLAFNHMGTRLGSYIT